MKYVGIGLLVAVADDVDPSKVMDACPALGEKTLMAAHLFDAKPSPEDAKAKFEVIALAMKRSAEELP